MNIKHKNCQERNKELLSLYTAALNWALECKVPQAHSTAVRLAVDFGRPRYQWGFDRAYFIVNNIIRHDRYVVSDPLRKAMWQEVAGMVQHVRSICPKVSIARALRFVLNNCRGSGFYLCDQQANACIYQSKKERTKALAARAKMNR